MEQKRIAVIKEADTWGNDVFRDLDTCEDMSKEEFVQKIENGEYPGYQVQEIAGDKAPLSSNMLNNNMG